MTILTKQQRAFLDTTVQKARTQSEAAAAHAIRRLTVTEARPGSHLSEPERVLRRELRSKATQLGDSADMGMAPLLIADIGYEQWHRLLFARFLEVNGLLRHHEMGIPLTLEDCGELADELGEPDAWSAAARFASETLPGVFRLTDPSVLVRYAREDLAALETLLASIPEESLRAEDTLGWVYQFWQTAQKKAVNESGRKIGGADISPVTQLFTENYMVRFLLENSLGAWWAGKHPDSPLLANWEYLRRLDDGTPAAGTFNEWPLKAAEVTVIDPCCGSGHFLVAAFGMLWRMRAEEEGLSNVDAQNSVLRDNVFGLELDPRCTQIAAFNLILEAWKQGGFRQLTDPRIACVGFGTSELPNLEEVFRDATWSSREAIARILERFKDRDSFGALLLADSRYGDELWHVDSSQFNAAVDALSRSSSVHGGVLSTRIAESYTAMNVLRSGYTLCATNPPFLGRPKQDIKLQTFCESFFGDSRHDLAYAFIDLATSRGGFAQTAAMVTPQAWLFQPRSESFRSRVLATRTIHSVSWLGPGAFSSIKGQVVQPALVIMGEESPPIDNLILAVDVSTVRSGELKAAMLREAQLNLIPQEKQKLNHKAAISYRTEAGLTLSILARSHQGIKTSDNSRFLRCFWEFPSTPAGWRRIQTSPTNDEPVSGRSTLAFWQDGYGAMSKVAQKGAPFRGQAAWGSQGFCVGVMGKLRVSLYSGELFDGQVVTAVNPSDLAGLWAYLRSVGFASALALVDRNLAVNTSALSAVQVPPLALASIRNPTCELPLEATSDVTQWNFSRHTSSNSATLQVAMANILGFYWPEQLALSGHALDHSGGIVTLATLPGSISVTSQLVGWLTKNISSERVSTVVDSVGGLEHWLRNSFFDAHTSIFHDRPFVWHIWDGLPDGFSAYVNYHLLDFLGLNRLTHSILGSWLARQQSELEAGAVGAERRYTAAVDLQRRLKLILEGGAPYDIHVRWKAMHEQPIGWEPDLGDGVRMNIRPFVAAGVLRSKVNIKWEKDRGKNPDGSDRTNDLHPSLAERRAAREAQA